MHLTSLLALRERVFCEATKGGFPLGGCSSVELDLLGGLEEDEDADL